MPVRLCCRFLRGLRSSHASLCSRSHLWRSVTALRLLIHSFIASTNVIDFTWKTARCMVGWNLGKPARFCVAPSDTGLFRSSASWGLLFLRAKSVGATCVSANRSPLILLRTRMWGMIYDRGLDLCHVMSSLDYFDYSPKIRIKTWAIAFSPLRCMNPYGI